MNVLDGDRIMLNIVDGLSNATVNGHNNGPWGRRMVFVIADCLL